MLDIKKCSNFYGSNVYKDILNGKTSEYIIEKYILHNIPYYFKDNMDLYYDIKKIISNKYNIPITNIFLVGSGQFGFSLSPIKDYQNFRENEDYENDIKASDLDFAIVSTKLFDDIWDELYKFKLTHGEKHDTNFIRFKDYLFRGWIRPDAFPYEFEKKKEWFEFFNRINPLVNRQVTCGIFRNETSFIEYYKQSIDKLILRTKEIKV